MNSRDLRLSAFPLLGSLIAVACGTTVEGGGGGSGGTGGAGGNPGATTSTNDGVTTATSTTSTSTTSTSTTSTSTTSTSTTSTGAGGGHIEPPSPPAGGPPSMGDATFAMSKLYLGDTDRDGTPDPTNGWKQYGFDLDGKISTAASTDLCQPRNSAPPKNVYPDGNGGIDNSFGRNILPMLIGISSDLPQKENDAILLGKTTTLFELLLGPGANYGSLGGAAYQGADLMMTPKFDGTDTWPVDPTSLLNPMEITSPRTTLPGYLSGNTWVGATPGELDLKLDISSFELVLRIQHAIVTLDLDADHQTGKNGTIAGVIAVDALTTAMKQLAGSFDPSLCSGPTIDSIVFQIGQAADILADGSQDPTKVCDGISIGLGFDAVAVHLGSIAPPGLPVPNPCP